MPRGTQLAMSMADLLIAQGNARAEVERRKGEVWGSTMSSLGQIPGQMLAYRQAGQDRQMALADRQSQQDFRAAQMANLTRDDARADRVEDRADVKALTEADTAQLDQALKRAELIGRRFGAVTDQASYDAAVNEAAQMGADTSRFPKAYSPGFVRSKQVEAFSAKDQLEAARPRFHNVPAGVSVLDEQDPHAGAVFTAPLAPKEPPNPTEASLAAAAAAGDREAVRALELLRQQRPARSQAGGTGQLSPAMESNILNRLTTQWQTAVKPAAELARQVSMMDAGMTAAERGDLAQGSQVLLVTFQKVLDPLSVVRESEYMRSAAGQSLMNRVKGAYERLMQGGAGVRLEELKKFAVVAREGAQAQAGNYLIAQKDRIGRTADHYRIPRDLVFEDFDFAEALKAANSEGGGGANNDPLGLGF